MIAGADHHRHSWIRTFSIERPGLSGRPFGAASLQRRVCGAIQRLPHSVQVLYALRPALSVPVAFHGRLDALSLICRCLPVLSFSRRTSPFNARGHGYE